ncbi:hypothetical protein [Thiocapsa marina]|uniref:Uncharacterized protein n=1 Tax=Thiocapsa marina 5811 TaxID=768671 RepID=F9UH94_9GAMM|nr:hypothetical protein [Thiocapsa marina]EGV16352.1 hypothetical protein ThimaDRAFT_4297 [Thiocapsa marina 5811]
MLNSVTLDEVINTALQLPPDQREMLIGILRHRQNEARRDEMAADARRSIALFHEGKLKAQSAEDAINDLHGTLADVE